MSKSRHNSNQTQTDVELNAALQRLLDVGALLREVLTDEELAEVAELLASNQQNGASRTGRPRNR